MTKTIAAKMSHSYWPHVHNPFWNEYQDQLEYEAEEREASQESSYHTRFHYQNKNEYALTSTF